MWPVSEETLNVMHELHRLRHSKSWFGSGRKNEQIIFLLKQLGDSGEFGIFATVFSYLSYRSQPVRLAAGRAFANLFSHLCPVELMQMVRQLAQSQYWYYSESWYQANPENVEQISGRPDETGHVEILGLLSFHQNGYVRHEALRRLIDCTNGRELPFLLIRQNDWVEQIALDAQAAVTSRTNDSYVKHIVDSLEIVFQLAKQHRRDHQALLDQVVDLLLEPKYDHFIRSLINDSNRHVARELVRLGLENKGEHQNRIIYYGLESDDPVIRLCSCLKAGEVFNARRLEVVLDQLANDQFIPIRREVLRIQAKHFPQNAASTWRGALIDRSRSIRELAQFSLKKLGYSKDKIAEHYRSQIAQRPELLSAIDGLAVTGDEPDVPYFRRLLGHPFSSRRVAAIKGLSFVLKEQVVSDALPLLVDGSPSVIRETRKVIQPYLRLVDGEQLVSAALAAPSFYARSNSVALIAEKGKWPAIPYLLNVAANAEPNSSQYAIQLIRRWCDPNLISRVFTRPTEQQRIDISASIQRVSGDVDEAIIEMVERDVDG